MTDKKDPLAKFFKKTRRLLNNLSDPNDPSIKYENFKNDASNWVNTAKLIKEIREAGDQGLPFSARETGKRDTFNKISEKIMNLI